MNLKEEWRPVVGYESHYEVSNAGRVRRTAVANGATVGKVRSAALLKIGYYAVGLSRDNKRRTMYVHDLVASAFLGPRPTKFQVNHIDGDKKNNEVANLEYVSHRENARHAARTGLIGCGEKNYAAKLTSDDVRTIRSVKGKRTIRDLAKQFGVSDSIICEVQNGLRWKHVTSGPLPS